MNNCRTCKHFGPTLNLYGDPFDASFWGSLTEDQRQDEFKSAGPSLYHTCTRIKHDDSYGKKGGDTAHVVDGSDYFAALRTTEDFGCVLWEAKE